MDFNQHTQPDALNEQTQAPTPNPQGEPAAPAPASDSQNQNPISNQGQPSPSYRTDNQTGSSLDQGQPPYGSNSNGNYNSNSNNNYNSNSNNNYNNNNNYTPYGGSHPYNMNGNSPFQGQPPYGSNNNYPYYNRNAYQVPYAEPGSSLANAAMILGIIAIFFCFTFTVYPAFVFGSLAIILSLLSKGRRPKLPSKARTGVICATIGLIMNTILVTSCITLLFTNPEVRREVNETFEKQYGVSFDEMMEEIMEENGFSE